jgi:hypothetical protein
MEEILKTKLTIAALFSVAAFLTPAHATGVLFTATTTLPSAGTYSSPLTLSLNTGTATIAAYGFDGVFSTTAPPSTVNVTGATSEQLDVHKDGSGTLGLGLNSNDTPYIGPGDAILLDFANAQTDSNGSGTGSLSQVTFNLYKDITGASDYVVYGMSNALGTGTGVLLTSGLMSSTGALTFSTSSLYSSYLVGITQDCALDIQNLQLQYSGTGTSSTPEPGTFVMAGMALIGLGATMKKRGRKV